MTLDEKINSLGFSVHENDDGGTYLKPVLSETGKLVYNHRIDILKNGIGSYEAGGGDLKDLGPASVVMSFDELEVFYKKSKKFKRKWRWQKRFRAIKQALFGTIKR